MIPAVYAGSYAPVSRAKVGAAPAPRPMPLQFWIWSDYKLRDIVLPPLTAFNAPNVPVDKETADAIADALACDVAARERFEDKSTDTDERCITYDMLSSYAPKAGPEKTYITVRLFTDSCYRPNACHIYHRDCSVDPLYSASFEPSFDLNRYSASSLLSASPIQHSGSFPISLSRQLCRRARDIQDSPNGIADLYDILRESRELDASLSRIGVLEALTDAACRFTDPSSRATAFSMLADNLHRWPAYYGGTVKTAKLLLKAAERLPDEGQKTLFLKTVAGRVDALPTLESKKEFIKLVVAQANTPPQANLTDILTASAKSITLLGQELRPDAFLDMLELVGDPHVLSDDERAIFLPALAESIHTLADLHEKKDIFPLLAAATKRLCPDCVPEVLAGPASALSQLPIESRCDAFLGALELFSKTLPDPADQAIAFAALAANIHALLDLQKKKDLFPVLVAAAENLCPDCVPSLLTSLANAISLLPIGARHGAFADAIYLISTTLPDQAAMAIGFTALAANVHALPDIASRNEALADILENAKYLPPEVLADINAASENATPA